MTNTTSVMQDGVLYPERGLEHLSERINRRWRLFYGETGDDQKVCRVQPFLKGWREVE